MTAVVVASGVDAAAGVANSAAGIVAHHPYCHAPYPILLQGKRI